MMTFVLVVMSGLPGAGKSSLAEALAPSLGAAVLAVDPVEAALRRAGLDPSYEVGVAAYEVVGALAEQQLRLGLTVIVDAVSSVEIARHGWRVAARRTGATLSIIEVVCGDERAHRQRLAARRRGLEGVPEPSWAGVVERRDEWEPWSEPHLVLDSGREIRENVAEALVYLDRTAVPPELG